MRDYPLSQAVPTGSTPVYVVDKNEYNNGSITGGPFAAITYKEIYDYLAGLLARTATVNTGCGPA